ncbi:S-layer homology domain-containing protein [Paenibacillus humicola]|uniref:S-layer homology domain-containing protein n=1 Tax=Paenibacillus humicola TaxID=3110540 RepID=UPI00237C25A6|nr:S-layer homology domain-containing protein [Paenibacillus humicola]
MKKLVLKKTAGLIVLLMTITMLVPIIAFASAGFQNITSSNGSVSGQVYVSQDVYDQLKSQNNSVQVEVYAENGFHWTIDTTYSNSAAGSVYFDFDVPSNVYPEYSKLRFNYFYPGSDVISDVYYDRNYYGSGGYYGGGGSSSGPIVVFENGNVDAASLIAALQADGTATITTDIETLYLPANALVGGKSLTIKNSEGVTYTLPIGALDLRKLADSVGVDLSTLVIRVDMKKVTGDDATEVANAVYKVGESVAPVYDFNVVAQGSGKEQEVNFGQYVSRQLPLSETVTDTTYNLTGVMFNPDTNELNFVPTTFATEDGKTTATLMRNGNSIYTVVNVKPVSFTDMVGNWAQKDVTTLASKLIVEGTGANKFEPKRNITRAEFAAMVVRSLGLDASGTASFKDVASNQWYAGSVAAAADAGIIKGYEDGSFKPNANITRKEVAAMVVRAMAYAGKDVKLSDADVSAALAKYTDAASLGWAKAEVAAAIKSGIVLGQTSTQVVGDANANRAEAATMIIRFLSNVGFIN